MSELVVGSIAGLASNSYEVGIASGSTLDLANAKAGSLPDTALSAVPGLDHIASFDVSGATSHTFGNAASPLFTTDYDNYKVIIWDAYQSGSVNRDLDLQLTADGVALTDAVYQRQNMYQSGGTIAAARASGLTSYRISSMGYAGTEDYTNIEMIFTDPARPKYTKINAISNYTESGTGILGLYYVGLVYNILPYDGFKLICADNFAAKVAVYGWKNA